MSISSLVRVVAFTSGLMLCSPAFSQVGPQIGRPPVNAYSRPVVSPYLNLLNPNNSFEFNYFQRYRPQVEARQAGLQNLQSIQNLQRQVNEERSAIQSANSTLGPTGHTARFLDTGSYFPRSGAGGGGLPGSFGQR